MNISKKIKYAAVLLFTGIIFSSCATVKKSADVSESFNKAGYKDGLYTAVFTTDSAMFHVTEAHKNKGVVTVKNGKMVIHVSLSGKSILNLYRGKAIDAKKNKKQWISYVSDTVTYDDGTSETVNGFDIPVSCINEDFDLALIGKKGIWYDHKVSVSDLSRCAKVRLEGGSGKASIKSLCDVTEKDGKVFITIVWSSSNFDYVICDGIKYTNENHGGASTFTIPVSDFTKPLNIVADTIAMGRPHEIDYTIYFEQW